MHLWSVVSVCGFAVRPCVCSQVVIGAPWEVTKDLVKVLNIHIVASGTNTKLDPESPRCKSFSVSSLFRLSLSSLSSLSLLSLSFPFLLSDRVVRMYIVVDPYKVPKELGIYREVEMSNTLCTDDVIKRIIDNRLKFERRNASRSKKEEAYIKNRGFVAEISNKELAPATVQ